MPQWAWLLVIVSLLLAVVTAVLWVVSAKDDSLRWTYVSVILSLASIGFSAAIGYHFAWRQEAGAAQHEKVARQFRGEARDKLSAIEKLTGSIDAATSRMVERSNASLDKLVDILPILAGKPPQGGPGAAQATEGRASTPQDVRAKLIPRKRRIAFWSGDGNEPLTQGPTGCARAVPVITGMKAGWPKPPPDARWVAHREPLVEADARDGPSFTIRRSFELPRELVPGSVKAILVGYVDDFLDVRVNDAYLGRFPGYREEFRVDLSAALAPGPNILDLTVINRRGKANETVAANPMGVCYRVDVLYEHYAAES